MKKMNSTTLALSAALLALMLTATACNNDNNAEPSPSVMPSPTVTASASPDAVEASPSAEPANAEQEGTGEYVGLADGHSIEIKTADGSNAFQISPEIEAKLDQWAEGTPVKYQFTEETIDVNGEKVTQYTIISIDKQ
jgi:hypothetical protein